jgi:hypothetical protein
MAIKYRSLVDFGAVLAGNREGINLGLDGSIFIRREAVERTFERPRIGTQGSSIGAAAASTDISAGSDDSLDVAVDGGAAVTAQLTGLAGLNTGLLIEAELESAINTALIADGQDARVWVFYDNADDHYEIYSQKTGLTTSVVVTDAGANNVADDLLLGVGNGGTEAAGTDDQDFFLYTTGGINFNQPAESNPHRTGRFHTGIVKQKKVVEFDMDAMLNMSGAAGDSLDNAIRLLYESMTGKETVVPATSIDYEQDLPNFTFSVVKASTIFAEYFTGCYVKDYTLTAPGDAPVTQKFTGMGSDGSIAGIGQVDGAVVASATVTLNSAPYPHAERFSAGARVMHVGADGRTILAGADGTLLISSVDTALNQVVLSAPIDADDDSYIVFWHPGAIQQTGRDNIFTDLEGSFKFSSSGNEVCATNIELSLVNDHVDLVNCFGTDVNEGFAAGNRATWSLSVTLDLSGENLGDLVQSRQFGGLDGDLIIGDVAGRNLLVDFRKWIVSVPPIDLPENGTTPVTFEGTLYQSQAGSRDPIKLSFR